MKVPKQGPNFVQSSMDCDGFCIRFLKKKSYLLNNVLFENESLNAYNFSSLEINISKKNRYFTYHKDALMIF